MLYTVDTALSVLALFCRIFYIWWPIILQRRGRDFAESDVDAEKLNKRDTLKCKERKRERERHARARTHARAHARACARVRKRKERRNKGRRGRYTKRGDREKEERMKWEKRGGEKKAWCNGGTSLRVSAPHQREALQPLDARTMPLSERRTGDSVGPVKDVKEEGRARTW